MHSMHLWSSATIRNGDANRLLWAVHTLVGSLQQQATKLVHMAFTPLCLKKKPYNFVRT